MVVAQPFSFFARELQYPLRFIGEIIVKAFSGAAFKKRREDIRELKETRETELFKSAGASRHDPFFEGALLAEVLGGFLPIYDLRNMDMGFFLFTFIADHNLSIIKD